MVHFFGDYSRSKVSRNKIIHVLEGFKIYEKASKPPALLLKAIREAQMFILDSRTKCPICEMLQIKAKKNDE